MKTLTAYVTQNIKLGAGTEVFLESVEMAPLDTDPKQPLMQLTVTLKLQAVVRVVRDVHCKLCEKRAPGPDEAAAFFMVRNHDRDRLCFPDAEDCRDERDSYPVAGWRNHPRAGLICSECHAALQDAEQATIRALKGKP